MVAVQAGVATGCCDRGCLKMFGRAKKFEADNDKLPRQGRAVRVGASSGVLRVPRVLRVRRRRSGGCITRLTPQSLARVTAHGAVPLPDPLQLSWRRPRPRPRTHRLRFTPVRQCRHQAVLLRISLPARRRRWNHASAVDAAILCSSSSSSPNPRRPALAAHTHPSLTTIATAVPQ